MLDILRVCVHAITSFLVTYLSTILFVQIGADIRALDPRKRARFIIQVRNDKCRQFSSCR